MYASVSFPISSYRTFTYSIPNSLKNNIKLGTCVSALLNNKIQTGFIVELKADTVFKGKILELQSIKNKELQIPNELWKTIEWVSKYYITPLGKVLKTSIPYSYLDSYKTKNIKFIEITIDGLKQLKYTKTKNPVQMRILIALSKLHGPVKISSLTNYASSPHSTCNVLDKKGWVHILQQSKIVAPHKMMIPSKRQKICLTREQEKVYKYISKNFGEFQPILLHGVTGSGKTEVYLRLAQKTIKQKQSVLVLVPEISLTPQVANRFHQTFNNQVAIWHSQMTKAEKGATWKKLKAGKYSVVIGARSAIFSPLRNLGLIIIDEEHEPSYKQETSSPRYHARDVAMIRGKYANATVLLSSATPCLESYYNAVNKKFHLLKLTKRYGKSIYPAIELIDMKKQFVKNNNKLISSELEKAIGDRINKSEQIILLQNRRGYSLIQRCLNCGTIKNCNRCSISMTFHKTDNLLHCHYCKRVENIESLCNVCFSDQLKCVGAGTQRIETVLKNKFKGIRILRMDYDTVRKKNAHETILQDFSNNNADVLLGTQMIAKGLDFDNVTLVGVINADSGLFFPDFRSGERVFQLIHQVSGRAGRREKQGLAIIQTYNPNDIHIQTATSLNISKFYNVALSQRNELNYPPFSRIGRIIFSGTNKNYVIKISQNIFSRLQGNKNYIILGPTLAPIEKIKNLWRSHLIIKTLNKKTASIHSFIHNNLGFNIFEKKWRGVHIQIDIDPVSMM